MTSPLDEAVERVPTLAQSMAEIADRDDTTGLAADALREGSELLRTILNALSPDEERVARIMDAVSREADKRPTGEGLVFSYGEVERGIRQSIVGER